VTDGTFTDLFLRCSRVPHLFPLFLSLTKPCVPILRRFLRGWVPHRLCAHIRPHHDILSIDHTSVRARVYSCRPRCYKFWGFNPCAMARPSRNTNRLRHSRRSAHFLCDLADHSRRSLLQTERMATLIIDVLRNYEKLSYSGSCQ
jgi:hypothetical protein